MPNHELLEPDGSHDECCELIEGNQEDEPLELGNQLDDDPPELIEEGNQFDEE